MKYQITHVGVLKASIIVGVLYALFGLILAFIGVGIMVFGPSEMNTLGLLYLTGPIWYGILGFVGTAIIVVLYNVLARLMGGIEYTLVPVGSATAVTSPPAPATAQVAASRVEPPALAEPPGASSSTPYAPQVSATSPAPAATPSPATSPAPAATPSPAWSPAPASPPAPAAPSAPASPPAPAAPSAPASPPAPAAPSAPASPPAPGAGPDADVPSTDTPGGGGGS